jgi:twitching motility protein PilT
VNLLDSLLQAVSRLEGDALVMHVGEKPYVVTTSASMYAFRGPLDWGQVELSSRVLTTEAVAGMLEQVLPPEQLESLVEFGAIEYELPCAASSDRFTVIAARGGDDVWLELRRTPAALETTDAAGEVSSDTAVSGVATEPREMEQRETSAATDGANVETSAVPPLPATSADGLPAVAETVLKTDAPPMDEDEKIAPDQGRADLTAGLEIVEDEPQTVPTDAEVEELLMAASAITVRQDTAQPASSNDQAEVVADRTADERAETSDPPSEWQPEPERARPDSSERSSPAAEQRLGVVRPIVRQTMTATSPVHVRPTAGTALERVLRIAAARGASTMYLVAQSPPVIRVDGEISVVEAEPALTATDVEGLVREFAAARGSEADPTDEWMADLPEVGRVRCVTFRDDRGPGVIFRMMPPKAIEADQLGLTPEVQALCAQSDGLVLVAGARASGKSFLLSAFVDLINRTRSDHIITIESQIGFVHESRRSFISQREVRAPETTAAALRSAFREDPDVLVIDDIRSSDVASAALEAAESERLVFGAVSAPSAVGAIDRVFEMFSAERRSHVQTALAGALRGVVAQMLLRRIRGGRVAAREILLNTPEVAALILEGKIVHLPAALDNGRRHGMMPLADSFAALVREGTIHAAEAYRKTPDRAALLAALRRDGVDTSFVERLA